MAKKIFLVSLVLLLCAGGVFAEGGLLAKEGSFFGLSQKGTSASRNHWISIGGGMFFGGARYELMLTPNFSVGIGYADFLTGRHVYARGALFPWSGKFYAGVGLGVAFGEDDTIFADSYTGLSLTPEVGWKIDVGREGAIFLQPVIKWTFVPVVFSGEEPQNYMSFGLYAGWAL